MAEAIEEQNTTGERLDHVLVRLGYVSNAQVLETIGQQFAMPIVDLSTIQVKADVLKTLPARLVFKQRCVPIEMSNGTLRVATCDPFELTAFDELRLLTGLTIDLVLADEQDLRKFIRAHYGVAGDTLDALADVQPVIEVEDSVAADLDEIAQASEASVIKLVNDLMVEAIRERATDIHIEPYEDTLSIRYRIDGVLSQAGVPPTISRFRNAIISRLKIMASLNIAEKRKPQDGRISLRRGGNEYDLRVSVIPMLFGEGVVLRILNKSTIMFDLEDLGMDREMLVKWDEMINMPHGISLVTGPTGCGKSTTLYASLQRIVSDEVKAITIEDPVEYHVSGVNQIPVHEKVGLTFATGLRSILRHDPDIIMIGEIRDLETAQAAVQASLTGHLVLLHAAHQRRDGGDDAAHRHGGVAVSRGQQRRRRPRPASGETDLLRMQGDPHAGEERVSAGLRSHRRADVLSRGRLPRMSPYGIPGPVGSVRVAHHERSDQGTGDAARQHQPDHAGRN